VYCRIIPEENIIHDRCAGCFPTASNSNGTTSTISSPNSRQTSRLFEAVSAAFVLATRRRALLQDVAALKAVLAKLDKGSDEAQASAWALLSALCHHMKAGASAGGLWGSAFCVITAALTEFLDVVVPDGQRCALVTVVEDLLQCQPADGGIECRDPAVESLTDGILVLRSLRASLDPCV